MNEITANEIKTAVLAKYSSAEKARIRMHEDWMKSAHKAAERWTELFGGDVGKTVQMWREKRVGLAKVYDIIHNEEKRREFFAELGLDA